MSTASPLSHCQFNMWLLEGCKGWQYVGPVAVRTWLLMYVVDWLQSTRLNYKTYLLRLAADRRTSLSSCVEQLGENTTCKIKERERGRRGRRKGRAMRITEPLQIYWSTSCRSHCQTMDLDHLLKALLFHHWMHARNACTVTYKLTDTSFPSTRR